jgi:hypothetical protein
MADTPFLALGILALHQGEEAVIALPIVMLAAAFFLLKWAAGGDRHDDDDEQVADASASPPAGDVEPRHLSFIGAGSRSIGEMAVEPPDERQPGDDPADHDG